MKISCDVKLRAGVFEIMQCFFVFFFFYLTFLISVYKVFCSLMFVTRLQSDFARHKCLTLVFRKFNFDTYMYMMYRHVGTRQCYTIKKSLKELAQCILVITNVFM